MSQVDEIFAEKRELLRELCRQYGVNTLELFGSASAGSFDVARSDFDFLVDFSAPPPGIDLVEQYFDFHAKLEDLFGRKVDLVELRAIRNPYFLPAIKPHRKVLYAA